MLEVGLIKERVLSDCPPSLAFWTCNGTICRNIYELCTNIDGLNEFAFKYHVNDDHKKNDFAIWIRTVLGDEVLAERLHAIREKDRYVDVIKERISELEHS